MWVHRERWRHTYVHTWHTACWLQSWNRGYRYPQAQATLDLAHAQGSTFEAGLVVMVLVAGRQTHTNATTYQIWQHDKFDQLLVILSELYERRLAFSVICLQESWLNEHDDTSPFLIPGCSLIHQGKICSQHGGLIISCQNLLSWGMCIGRHSKITTTILLKCLWSNFCL